MLCGLVGAAIEIWGLRRVHHNGHIAELLFTFGLAFIIEKVRADDLGHAAGALPRAASCSTSRCSRIYGTNFPPTAPSCC